MQGVLTADSMDREDNGSDDGASSVQSRLGLHVHDSLPPIDDSDLPSESTWTRGWETASRSCTSSERREAAVRAEEFRPVELSAHDKLLVAIEGGDIRSVKRLVTFATPCLLVCKVPFSMTSSARPSATSTP